MLAYKWLIKGMSDHPLRRPGFNPFLTPPPLPHTKTGTPFARLHLLAPSFSGINSCPSSCPPSRKAKASHRSDHHPAYPH